MSNQSKKIKMRYGMGAELLWKDRKRYFGLPWSFTRYRLIKNGDKWLKLFSDIGLLYSLVEELNLYRVQDVTLHQSLFDKIFGTGTIILYSNDERTPEFRLRHIAHPYKIREMLSNLVEEQRKLHNVRVSEFQY